MPNKNVSSNSGSREARDDYVITPLAVLRLVLRNLWTATAMVVASALLGLFLVLLWPSEPEFIADSRFIPEDVSAASQTSSLVQRLGLAQGGEGGGTAIEFYRELISSRELLQEVVRDSFQVTLNERSGTVSVRAPLAEFYDDVESVGEAIRKLKRDINVELSPATRLVTLETTAPLPELAVEINRRILRLVEQYNVERRQSEVRSERQFVEARLKEAGRQLRDAEEDLARFLERNRSWEASPQLAFQRARLERQVSLHSGLYQQLAQSYENARINEVRNTPVLTMFESPQIIRRSARASLGRGVALGVIFGIFLSFTVVLFREVRHYLRRQHPAEYAEVLALARSYAPGTLLARWRGRGRTNRTQDPLTESGPGMS